MYVNTTDLQIPYADTDPNAKTANVVPTNNGADSSRYVPIYEKTPKQKQCSMYDVINDESQF